jgi:hypothetical protein
VYRGARKEIAMNVFDCAIKIEEQAGMYTKNWQRQTPSPIYCFVESPEKYLAWGEFSNLADY